MDDIEIHPDNRVLAIDRDPVALAKARALQQQQPFRGRLAVVDGRFSQLRTLVAGNPWSVPVVDGVVLDVGVSSMQLDDASRGFSYKRDGPLDMRMRQPSTVQAGRDEEETLNSDSEEDSLSAYEVVNTFPKERLAQIIRQFGEERHADRIAQQIAIARQHAPISSTHQLAHVVYQAVPGSKSARVLDKHPAIRTFQALRIFVNEELRELERGLEGALAVLQPQTGRLVVVTFHSLEDTVVMEFYRRNAHQLRQLHSRSIRPSEEEVQQNPRSRSARLRAFQYCPQSASST